MVKSSLSLCMFALQNQLWTTVCITWILNAVLPVELVLKSVPLNQENWQSDCKEAPLWNEGVSKIGQLQTPFTHQPDYIGV